MMNKRESILIGVTGVTVAGLIALAIPALAMFAGSMTTGFEAAAEQGSAATSTVPLSGSAGEGPAPVDAELEAAGYQDIGGGVSIPAKGPGDCPTWAAIHPYDAGNPAARLGGTLTDLGPTAYASGEVGLNDDGEIATYTVASGDTGYGIGDRLCVDYVTLLSYNGRFISGAEIQPGDVLILRP